MPKTRLHAARAAFLAAAIALTGTAAHAESPFHTGVWQVNEPTGPNGLVVSDWQEQPE